MHHALGFFAGVVSSALLIGVAVAQPNETGGRRREDNEVRAALAGINKDLQELKSAASPWPAAALGAIGAILAAAAGAYAVIRAERGTNERENALARDDRIGGLRVKAYSTIFAEFKAFPRFPGVLPAANDVSKLANRLTDLYFDEGAGLVMSVQSQNALIKVRNLLKRFGPALSTPLTSDEFAAVYYCCSTLRTALIADVDGRRRLGDPASSHDDADVKVFLEFKFSDDTREAIGRCTQQQKANDDKPLS